VLAHNVAQHRGQDKASVADPPPRGHTGVDTGQSAA
jgi:hypothetical protein